jgi:hypothetical protein
MNLSGKVKAIFPHLAPNVELLGRMMYFWGENLL